MFLKNHHKQAIAPKQGYPLQVSQACRGIKNAPKEATYKQRLPSSSLKNWEILLKQVHPVNYPDCLLLQVQIEHASLKVQLIALIPVPSPIS